MIFTNESVPQAKTEGVRPRSTISLRICNREGCTRHVFARAKCVSHYNSYLKSLRRKGSDLFAAVNTWAEVQKHMPGTLYQLAARTGISYNTVMRTVNKRHKAGDAHIKNHLPPQQCGGARWVRVFALGAGDDHVVSEKRKASYSRRRKRELHAAKRAAQNVPAPQFATHWNLAFFNPAKAQFCMRAAA
jgi:hypothetical protein